MLKISDLCYSETAERLGISNEPLSYAVKQKLGVLVKVLNYAGISKDRIISAYRSPGLNKEVGGAFNSKHMLGSAVDISCSNAFDCISTINILNASCAMYFAHVDYFYMSRSHRKIHIDFVFTRF